MKRKVSFKLISCFLVLFLGIHSLNTVVSNKNVAYGDTLENGQVNSNNQENEIKPEEALDLEEGLIDGEDSKEETEVGLEEEKEETEVGLEEEKEEDNQVDEEDESYITDEDNVYISPEDVVAREESDNTLNSLQSIAEPEDTYIYESVYSVETIANSTYSEDVNGDGMIDEKDLDLVSAKYNLKSGDSGYISKYDVNSDGIIDLFDLTSISSKLGTVCGKLIAIDPGHGGSDPGAIGPSGLREKTVVLNVGLMVRDMLIEKGYRVIMTRTGDYRLSENSSDDLKERANIANDANADLFVSIHANSFSSSSAHGIETFYHKNLSNTSQAAKLAGAIQTNLVNALKRYNRGVKTADFSVLRNTKMDAALTELAFISNPEEEKLLGSESFQRNAAKAIVDGIVGSLN